MFVEADSISMDAAVRFFDWSRDDHVDPEDNRVFRTMSESSKPFIPTPKQAADIILCRNDALGNVSLFDLYAGALTQVKTARIGKVKFTAGEPVEGDVSVSSVVFVLALAVTRTQASTPRSHAHSLTHTRHAHTLTRHAHAHSLDMYTHTHTHSLTRYSRSHSLGMHSLDAHTRTHSA